MMTKTSRPASASVEMAWVFPEPVVPKSNTEGVETRSVSGVETCCMLIFSWHYYGRAASLREARLIYGVGFSCCGGAVDAVEFSELDAGY